MTGRTAARTLAAVVVPLALVLTVTVTGCATAPRPVTKIVNGHIVVSRPISPAAYEHVTRALLYEEEERWEEAAAELQRALPFDSEAPELHAHLAELFIKLGRLDDAGDQVQRSLRVQPTVDGWVASAHVRQARGDIAGTLDSLRHAVALTRDDEDPDGAEHAYLELAEEEIVALEIDAAFQTTRQLVGISPDSQRARVQLAALAWALGKLDDAESSLRAALEQEPGDVESRLMLAELQVASGKIKAAKASFREAMDRSDSPLEIAAAFVGWLTARGDKAEATEIADRLTAEGNDPQSLEQMSRIERAAKRNTRAQELASRAAKAGATAGRVALLVGAAQAAEGKNPAAVMSYLSVPTDSSEYLDARLRAAELLRDQGKTDEAGKLIDKELAAVSDADARASLLIGRSLIDEKVGDAARAARRLDDGLVKDPGNQRLLMARAAVEDRRGDWRSALTFGEKVLSKDPRNVEALNFVGFVAAEHAFELPRATRRLQAAIALNPGTGGILDSLGWAYFRAGDLARAALFLDQANRLDPGDPEILEHLGDLSAGRQDPARALEIYRQAQSLSPSDRVARELQDRVRTLEAKSAAGR
ncbi:MAG TPA: tetratricopeptide repeat protein [Polyangia bacterium]|nr:tetratricopeptide repeat protein [Polyangia bacterium]